MADLFNKVLSGINKGVNSVSENSKLFVEKAKLNNTLKETENKKNTAAQQLGMTVYELQKAGEINIEQLNDKCAEIEKYNNEIEELNLQILNLQNTLGEKKPAAESAAENYNGIKCSCGYYNKEGAAFCAKCGSKLNTNEEVN